MHLPRLEGWGEAPPVKNGPALGGYGALAMNAALIAAMTKLPEQLRKTLTWDRGKELSAHAQFTFDSSGRASFEGRPVARLVRGPDLLRPDVALADHLEESRGPRSRVQRRLVAAARDLAAEILAPLRSDRIGTLSGAARGLIYQLEHGLGTTSARTAREQLRALGFNV